MKFEGSSTFAKVIEEHLDLKRRNAHIECDMPIQRYQAHDPFENHPLFKTEEQARLEETLTGSLPAIDHELALAWPIANGDREAEPEDTLWGRSRDFDWGD